MDILGRNRISDALKNNLKSGGEAVSFWIQPDEYELRGSGEATEDCPESVRFVDISTKANPSRVLECLHNSGLLETEIGASKGVKTPELRVLGIINNGGTTTLTFEDVAENR